MSDGAVGETDRVSISADPTLFVGEDGFEFHSRERCFEQLCGDAPLEAADLRRWTVTLESRHAWAQLLGMAYLPMIVPERHVVYWDRLPDGVVISPNRPVRLLRTALAASVQADFVYPEQALRAGRGEQETFPREEGGWTAYGAYVAYRALAEAMGRHAAIDPIGEDELTWPPGEEDDEAAAIGTTRPVATRRIFGNAPVREGHVQIFAGGKGPRLVLFGDEGAGPLVDPFLCAHFSRIVLVGGGRYFLPDLIRAEKPDMVVSMIPEYHLGAPALFANELERIHFTGLTGVPLPLPGE